jgi:hypothetical protein
MVCAVKQNDARKLQREGPWPSGGGQLAVISGHMQGYLRAPLAVMRRPEQDSFRWIAPRHTGDQGATA